MATSIYWHEFNGKCLELFGQSDKKGQPEKIIIITGEFYKKKHLKYQKIILKIV